MRDIFIESLYACGTLLLFSATMAAVRFLGGYALRRAQREIVVTGNTVTVGSGEPDAPTLIAVPATPINPKAVIEKVEEDFAVQCGQCKMPILSKPIRSDLGEGGKARLIYKCEHCGANVGIKA